VNVNVGDWLDLGVYVWDFERCLVDEHDTVLVNPADVVSVYDCVAKTVHVIVAESVLEWEVIIVFVIFWVHVGVWVDEFVWSRNESVVVAECVVVCVNDCDDSDVHVIVAESVLEWEVVMIFVVVGVVVDE
jgi:hypothetical protein